MARSAPPTHIVVVSAGFAGTNLVRALARRLPPTARLTPLSDESFTTFNPMLPEAVGSSVFPEQVRRSGAGCASSSSGRGACSFGPTSRTCASRAAMR